MRRRYWAIPLASLALLATPVDAGVVGKAAGPRLGDAELTLYDSLEFEATAHTVGHGDLAEILDSGTARLGEAGEKVKWLAVALDGRMLGYAKRDEVEILPASALRCVAKLGGAALSEERKVICLRKAREVSRSWWRRTCYRDDWIGLAQGKDVGEIGKTDDGREILLSARDKKEILAYDPDAGRNWCAPETGVRLFTPKIRIYFDTGDDDEDEIDIFRDGSAAAAVDLAEFRLSWPIPTLNYDLERPEDSPPIRSPFSFGIAIGGGIGTPAGDSEDREGGEPEEEASGAPVLLLNAGLFAEAELPGFDRKRFARLQQEEHQTRSGIHFVIPKLVFEVGYTQGVTADESISDTTDGAIYVGLGVTLPFGT